VRRNEAVPILEKVKAKGEPTRAIAFEFCRTGRGGV